MSVRVNNRISSLPPSPTMTVSARAAEMRRQGIDVLSFAAGEPDFPTPAHVVDAAIAAMRAGKTTYTAAVGLVELREAICRRLRAEIGVSFTPAEVVVSPGAKYALFAAFQVLLERGDEVIIPAPYWVSFPEQVRLADGVPVIVDCPAETGFALDPEALRAAITERTRVIVLNSPGNPTGAVYSRQALESVLDVVRGHRGQPLWVLSDETYSRLVFDGAEHFSPAQIAPDLRDQILIASSLSKTYAMTGWRVGFLAAPKDVITAIGTLQSHSNSNVNTIAQWAAIAALDGDQTVVESMREAFSERRKIVLELLAAVPGFSCGAPSGAFYVFPSTRGVMDSSLEMARILLEEARVAVVPGDAFGAPGHLRISYATSLANLRTGIERIRQAVENLARR
ncbi:MAG: pyridoxal phosphate-dependent aminotransferase [Candidatus Schekmanbacteria bacterium]|nr:pyridoxal phosphate-dependent aminotransferase [Candidatus Schekmanbacteria bacterium]